METKKLRLNKPSKWFIENALKMHELGLVEDGFSKILNYTKKFNYRSTFQVFNLAFKFKERQIVGRYGWIHSLSLTEEERLHNSERYQKIFLNGVEVSKYGEWSEGFNVHGDIEFDAPYAEPQIKVSKFYEGVSVETLRVNLFIDDNPDPKRMDDYYLDHCFNRDVVVIKVGDKPTLLPCAYAWLLSPDWDSFCSKAWEEIIFNEPHEDNHELKGWWPKFKEGTPGKPLSTLYF